MYLSKRRRTRARTIKISSLTVKMRKIKKFIDKIGAAAITSAICLLVFAGFISLYLGIHINGLDKYFLQTSNKNKSASLVADRVLQGEAGFYNLGLIFNQEIAYRNIGEQNYNDTP